MKDSFVSLIDGVLNIAGVLFALFCLVNVVSSLRHGFLIYTGRKVRRKDDPITFWLLIGSWLVILVLLLTMFIKRVL